MAEDLFRADRFGVGVTVYKNHKGELEMNVGDDSGDNITINKRQALVLIELMSAAMRFWDLSDR